MNPYGKTKAFDAWMSKQSPEWLMLASQSDAYGHYNKDDPRPSSRRDTRTHYPNANKYVGAYSSVKLPDFAAKNFIAYFNNYEEDSTNAKGLYDPESLLSLLQREGEYYFKAFALPGTSKNPYTQELIKQIEETYGETTLGRYKWDADYINVNGNMYVALAVAAIRDTALTNYLHRKGEITDIEKKASLDHINERMDRIGLNGVDLLLESRPDLIKVIEQDERKLKGDDVYSFVSGLESRSQFYKTKVKEAERDAETQKSASSIDTLTRYRTALIGKGYDDLQQKKHHHMLVHVHDLPPLQDKERAVFEQYLRVTPDAKITEDHPDLQYNKKKLEFISSLKRGNNEDRYYDYLNAYIQDGLAINHPQRETFVASLRERMKASEPDPNVVDAEFVVKDASSQPLLGIDSSTTPPPVDASSQPLNVDADASVKENDESKDKEKPAPLKDAKDDVIEGEFEVKETSRALVPVSKDKDKAKETNYDNYVTAGKIGLTAAIGAAVAASMRSGSKSKDENPSSAKSSSKDDKGGSNKTFYAVVAVLAAVAGIALVWKTPLVESIVKSITRSA
jgi:hypothetical protein